MGPEAPSESARHIHGRRFSSRSYIEAVVRALSDGRASPTLIPRLRVLYEMAPNHVTRRHPFPVVGPALAELNLSSQLITKVGGRSPPL